MRKVSFLISLFLLGCASSKFTPEKERSETLENLSAPTEPFVINHEHPYVRVGRDDQRKILANAIRQREWQAQEAINQENQQREQNNYCRNYERYLKLFFSHNAFWITHHGLLTIRAVENQATTDLGLMVEDAQSMFVASNLMERPTLANFAEHLRSLGGRCESGHQFESAQRIDLALERLNSDYGSVSEGYSLMNAVADILSSQ